MNPAHVELPASGSGPLLVLFAGADGPQTHLDQARAFSRAGWVVLVIDSNRYQAAPAERIRELLKHSLARPEVRSPKASIVGYSLGGWLVLAAGNRMPDLVSAAVAYYPSTSLIDDPKAFLEKPAVGVPTLVLAGVQDTYANCCTIDRARALAAAAALPDIRAPLQLVEYPQADHGFVMPAYRQVYRPDDDADAMRRSTEHLRKFVPG
jgi:dienelactone hydrolase